MTAAEILQNGLTEKDPLKNGAKWDFPGIGNAEIILQADGSYGALCSVEIISKEDLLLKTTRVICVRNKIEFADLSQIQRKFLTHYRCSQCGLLPLYYVNLLHVKRVRCRKCGHLIAFKGTGKFGKLRKEIAFDLVKLRNGDDVGV